MTSLADVLIADPSEVSGNSDAVIADLREAVTTTPAQDMKTTESKDTAAPATTDVPEKFRGKSVKDVVEMYQNLESRLGVMANDLGVQRQLTDRILDLKRSDDLRKNTPAAERAKPVPVTANDLLDRPQETLERVVEAANSRVTEDVNARLARMEASLAQQTFTARHPDFQTVVAKPDFVSWVQASPIRLRAAAAANQGNWQIADELLTEFKGGKQVTTEPTEGKQPSADLAGARKAALETSGSAGTTDGKSSGGKKTYRRADLMRLRINDPEAYYDESFQNEILQAHAEGRVK